jgi:hypothetical protein
MEHPMARLRVYALALAMTLAACVPGAGSQSATVMDEVAESYVRLVLAVGEHDTDYVDAYYGPQEWRDEVTAEQLGLSAIAARADALIERLRAVDAPDQELERLRYTYLATQLGSLTARVDMLGGRTMTFDEESRALYDAVAPTNPGEYYASILEELDDVLPPGGSITERFGAFRSAYVIPPDRLDAVFMRAIEECRERTLEYVDLPEGESFVVEYVTDQSWSGYNWYQGGYHSLIQVNVDFPSLIDRAVDLACHEGYPGHHTYNALLEHDLVNERGWPEYSVYALFSPQSFIAEGSANFGIEMAFPGNERLEFERDVLFPIAGLDPSTAESYYRVQDLVARMNYAGNEAARLYIDGDVDADGAVDWLVRYAMYSPGGARQRLRFVDQYRSYVINYNLGLDLVRDYVDGDGTDGARAGATPDVRWDRFMRLLASPRLPGDL